MSQVSLVQGVGRGREVDEKVHTQRRKLLSRVKGISGNPFKVSHCPDVFAHRHADSVLLELEHETLWRRFEVPGFVKDIVGRQKSLTPFFQNLSVVDKGHAVEESLPCVQGVSVHVTTEDMNTLNFPGKSLQGEEVLLDESRPLQ